MACAVLIPKPGHEDRMSYLPGTICDIAKLPFASVMVSCVASRPPKPPDGAMATLAPATGSCDATSRTLPLTVPPLASLSVGDPVALRARRATLLPLRASIVSHSFLACAIVKVPSAADLPAGQ